MRLHDHEGFFRASESGGKVIPVFCIDPRQFEPTSFGFPKTGSFRTQFLLESLHSLRASLRDIGGELYVRIGRPEDIIPELSHQISIDKLIYQQEVTTEETQVERALEKKLFSQGIDTYTYWGATLYHKDDLPIPINSLPPIFTQFRKQVEKQAKVRAIFPSVTNIVIPQDLEAGEIPDCESLGVPSPHKDSRSVIDFYGGESEALKRLDTYFWTRDCLKEYKETRNGLLGADYSSKFSAWLALGCISPRQIYQEVKRYEKERKKNSSTYWMIFELIWRDYFRFIAKKHGNSLFYEDGIKGEVRPWDQHQGRFEAWKEGRTGIPFIDANIRELNATGFMSNRGRQNVASFLVNDLRLDWRMGAAYFESQLIDYDVCSNYGNWNYVAGIGNDPRENRYFNVITQGKRYDAKGNYIKTWIPELHQLPETFVHTPYDSTPKQLMAYDVNLGSDYPFPVVKFQR